MKTEAAQTNRAGPPTSISQAQSVATRGVAMMLKGHHPQPSPPSAMNGMVAMLPKTASRRAVRE